MSTVKPIPDGSSVVMPMLVCRDVAAAIDFCKTAFGAVTRNQQIQRWVAIDDQPYVDSFSIRSFLQRLCYPIHFLDFETLWTAIPPFDGVRPYEQISFQFSLHILSELDAVPTQHMFLAEGKSDPQPELLAKLRESVEETGSIVAYNANFETARLRECCKSFPEFLPWLERLENRIVDLLLPFRSFHYYHPKQLGSASMKRFCLP